MKTIDPTTTSNITPQPKWLTLLRIILGFIILWKGFTFFKDAVTVENLLKNGNLRMLNDNSSLIAFLITYLNLLGGFFIIVGLFTRWICLIQIPIIIVAIVFINTREGAGVSGTELVLSIIVLILLVLFTIKGSGYLSADEYFNNYTKAALEPGHTKNIL